MESDDSRHLREAIALARASVAAGGGPFGALVVRAGHAIASGTNRVTLDGDPTAHAEVVAIRAACRALGTHDLSDCTLFASCEPCPMCLGAAQWARLARIEYAADRSDAAAAGFDDSAFHEALRAPDSALPPVRSQQRLAEARAPFDDWLARPDRQAY